MTVLKIQIVTMLLAAISGSAVGGESAGGTEPGWMTSASWARIEGSASGDSAVTNNSWSKATAGAVRGTAKDPNFALSAGKAAGTRELFIKMMVSVFIVVCLGAGAIYASKKVMGKFTKLSGKKVKVIETTYLGPRKAVHLLRIGDRHLLIGSTNENITKLADLTTEFMMHEKGYGEVGGLGEVEKAGAGLEFDPRAPANMSTTYVQRD